MARLAVRGPALESQATPLGRGPARRARLTSICPALESQATILIPQLRADLERVAGIEVGCGACVFDGAAEDVAHLGPQAGAAATLALQAQHHAHVAQRG